MASWVDIFRAQLYASIAWMKNNRFLFMSMFIWPYIMVGMVYFLGSIYGRPEVFSQKLGVSNPAIYLLASSAVAMSSLFILDAVAGFALYNRWLGTLPYILLTPIKTPILFIVAGLPETLLSTIIIILAVMPGAIYFEGAVGGLKLLLILLIIMLGMIPMLGFSSLIASILLIVKEESNILSSITPFVLLVSGIFYPVEVLPRLLQLISRAIPVTYVLEASKIIATYYIPEVRLLFTAIYIIGAMALTYNLFAAVAIGRAERAVKRVGQYE
jgi:ABC-2 type transport system permease protein